ncbi:Protein PalA [Klebsiella aerogenes]|uniref:PalA n=1 Tax=Klebsiella aerogenes (strain ATCC 13048 / DSM 30053 / CCUG 1429 / JCM 1235 / KCTC 2190 / NBRC 13534 / NCIMB 10102 / NCTC 10006 / CDC 819-56) TaxID=1028307 RepID=A0A0H3FMW2_KLEAK|nr:PalA [Klebsiella aerogenes KCTC 2190]VDZ70115.1 protein PalA [Klebsiella aerogenes]
MNLIAAQDTQLTSGSNKSSGGSIGVGVGVGSGGAGISISANANSSKGHEKGNGTWQNETTVDAGHQVTIASGRDTTLAGAQVSGHQVTADVGRDLTITSLQDSDHYDSTQNSVSGGLGYTFGAGSFSGSLNVSRDKMNSDYDSVQEQSGLFAGQGGFDVTVGNHTQLNGGVIASTGSADKNSLDTGTLGFSDIHNQADYKTQHQGGGISTGGSIGSQFAGNMASALLAGGGNSGHAEGSTQAAVADGIITIRDKDNQKQDVADLSRDTEHANGSIGPIFDKEKEQRRLQEVQLIGETGSQAADIARTQGEIAKQKAMKDPAALTAVEAKLKAEGNSSPTAEQIAEQAGRTAMQDYGTGSDLQRGIQAATAALQGLAGGNIAGALAGASAPELANIIGHQAGLKDDDIAAKTIAHAILGGAVAALQGGNAAAGAAGAATGELVAKAILETMYPGRQASDLSESDKQLVSNLATIASGFAGNIVGGDSQSATTGAQSGKNAVENNFLSSKEARQLDKEMQDCKKSGGDCNKVVEKYIDISNKKSKELQEACTGGGVRCVSWQELIQGATNVANDANPHQIRLDEKLKDPSAAALVNYLNGVDLKFLQDNITQGDRILSVVMDPTSWPVAIMGGKAIITNTVNNTKEQLIAVGVGAGLSAGIQYGTTGKVSLSDLIGSGVIGAITAGKGYDPVMTWNAVGGYYQAEIKGDDPFMAALVSKAGASAGYTAGNVLKVQADKIFNPISKQYEWVPTGVWTITKPVPQSSVPSISANAIDSFTSGVVGDSLNKAISGGKNESK